MKSQDLYKSRSPLYDDENIVACRLQAVNALGRLLQKTGAILDGSEPEQTQLYRQVDILSFCLSRTLCLKGFSGRKLPRMM